MLRASALPEPSFAVQQGSSKADKGSAGKPKRWSALAFWRKGSAKSRQPAASQAQESLAPDRRRSSYNASFIALAKQVLPLRQLLLASCRLLACVAGLLPCKQLVHNFYLMTQRASVIALCQHPVCQNSVGCEDQEQGPATPCGSSLVLTLTCKSESYEAGS